MNTSPLLELLSHTALKGAAVLLVALLAGLSLRKVAAARRYAIWITAVAALAVLPLAMTLLPAWRVLPQTTVAMDSPVFEPEMPDENPEPILLSVGAKISFPASAFETQAPAPVKSWPAFSWQDAVDALPAAWITLAALLLLRLGWSAWRLHRLERSLESGTCAALDETAREVGLERVPRLLIGAANAVPMVWGVWRPRLLLPADFESWTADKLRGVLLHELAHLKRGDPLALWIAQWVKALHWFNPLAWLTIRQLRADQERACDDAVLRHGVRASDYAQHLLDLSRHARIAPGLALCALTITRCAPVEARVKAILDPKRHREALTPRWLLGLAGFALLTILPVAMLHAIEGAKLRGRILDRNGVVLAESTPEKVRHYPLKALAAHMIGYTRKTDDQMLRMEGYTGIEKQQDVALAAGEDVTLAFDMRIQSLAHRAMTEAGVKRGAVVVLDPRTGEVLAAVSLPIYDPNIFVPSITQRNWDAMLKDLDHPLLNRCVRGFAPGSTYKLLTGLAGGAAGISGQKFNCTGSVTYGSTVMQCWKQRQDSGGHGVLGMSDALAASCSCFWYQFGNAAGIEQIESMGRKIGFGSTYGITDHEDTGILPSPSWLKQHRPTEKWSNGYTANTSIGQGMVLATPLQMAVLAATVGNGGKVPQPGIIKQNGESTWRADLSAGELTAAAVGQLREGMRLVVNADSGTGKAAKSDKVIIAGKTGTAQNWRRDANGAKQVDNHGWFIGFAPFENPKLAFAIIKNGAKSGGGDCGPIAKRIVEEALALPADGSGEVKPVNDSAVDDWEKIKAQGASFDAKTAAISSAIKLAETQAGEGLLLKESKIGNGRLTLRGEASGMIQALQFREKLVALCKGWLVDWTFPVPETLADGKRVKFQAEGLSAVAAEKEKERTRKHNELSRLGPAELMNQLMQSQWATARRVASLAELPQGARLLLPSAGASLFRDGPGLRSVFTAPRAEAFSWLRQSLREESGQLRDWPARAF
jgi:beta-lactamase regulating signal transducer with metallopeptidase domain/beta-lactamase class D